jgi:hypothetical protein
LAILGAATAAQAAGYKFKFHDTKAPGANETDAYAVNNSGKIAGDYLDSANAIHGMILKGKTLTTIDDPNGSSTIGQGINSKGVVVGYYTNTKTGIITGFKYSKGTFTDIAPKGAIETEASGVDTKGHVVGVYVDSAGVTHGFYLSGKKFKKLDISGAQANYGWGINDSGLITGYQITSAGGYEGWTTSDLGKTYTNVNDPNAGSTGTVCHTPDTNGDVVGTYFDSTPIAHGFLLIGGNFYNFDDPKAPQGGPGTRGDGLNDKSNIVGRYGAGPNGGNGGYGFEATYSPN